MATKVLQTLEYRGGQLNAAPVPEVENFTNWKKIFMCHIIGIEPQFENIIKNDPFIPMVAGQRKPEGQWTADERKAANLDQRLKSLIINTNHVKDFELASLFGKLKYEENLIDSIYETEKNKLLVSATPLSTAFFSTSIVQDFQDSPNDEEDTRSTPSNQSPFQPKPLNSSQHKPELRPTKEFEAKYNKIKAKLALLSSSASAPNSSSSKNKGLIVETYEWDEEEVSSNENKAIEVKALMALVNEERVLVGKESASNGEWVKISIQKVHTLLEMENDNDRKSFIDYLCIDINYVEEQRNNLLSKHRNLVQELNTCKEQLLVLKQAKLDFLTMQHVNTKILKENQNLRNKLKELTSLIETWLNSSNKVNQCISEQIPTQKKKILGIDQLTKDTSNSGPKDLVFVKSLADNLNVSITSSNKPRLSEAEDSTLPNHDIGKVPSDESQRNTTDPLVVVSDSSATNFDLADESSVCITLKEPSSSPAKDNRKCTSASKTFSAPAGKLKNVKIKDDPPLATMMKELNELKLQLSKNKSSYSRTTSLNRIISLRRGIKPRNPQHVTKNYITCGSNVHTTTDHNDIEWFRKGEALKAKKDEANKIVSLNVQRSKTSTKRLEASKIFFAFSTYMNFIVYQMDVKSAFLNDKLGEEVYVKQPLGFESSEFPNHVCKSDKPIYGLKQAPKAWTLDSNGKVINLESSLVGVGSKRVLGSAKSRNLLLAGGTNSQAEVMGQSDLVRKVRIRTPIERRLSRFEKEEALLEDVQRGGGRTDLRALVGFSVEWPAEYPYFMITSAIAISNNLALHSRTKHIDIRYHFIRDHILKRDIELHSITTQYQLADIFTKPLDEPTFKRLIVELVHRRLYIVLSVRSML
ncbi:retrovirus-related pol polyprotein from transposon TNT 1-94 [Tanacetum coccineum]